MILIVSADLQFRTLVGAELREKGYEAEGVETMADSLRVWAKYEKPPDLILIDASGQDFSKSSLALIAELARKSSVLVCAGTFEVSQVDFTRYGVKSVITKPLTVGEVVAEVANLVGPPS